MTTIVVFDGPDGRQYAVHLAGCDVPLSAVQIDSRFSRSQARWVPIQLEGGGNLNVEHVPDDPPMGRHQEPTVT